MPKVSATRRSGSVCNGSNAGSGIPVIRVKSNFIKILLRIHSYSRSAIPTGGWASSAGWSTTAGRTGRAVSSTGPFTAGRPTPEKRNHEPKNHRICVSKYCGTPQAGTTESFRPLKTSFSKPRRPDGMSKAVPERINAVWTPSLS